MSKRSINSIQFLFDSFIKECRIYNKSEPTIIAYNNNYDRLCDFDQKLPDKQIGTMDKNFVVRYTEFLVNRSITTASINHYLRSTRVFLYWCMENTYIQPFKISMVRERESLKDPYTKEELSVLLRKPDNTDEFATWRTWATINWILALGSRASTVTDIRVADLDLKGGTIIMRHNKNGKVQSQVIPPSLRKALILYMRHRPMDSEYLFCGQMGQKLLVNGLRNAVSKYNRSRGVSKTSVHLFRHTFGAMWARNGGDVYELQNIFGHSDIRITQKYINIYGSPETVSKFIQFNPLENM